jgi:purine-binding chemotaxis protein CheW
MRQDPPEPTTTQDADAIQRILEERALVLARSPEKASAGDSVELVILIVGKERYGIAIEQVHEIQALAAALTSVPGVPFYWVGLMNLRGRLHPVLDLGAFLTATPFSAPEGSKQQGRAVLVSAAGLEVGLLVDDVPQVRRVLRSEIGPPLSEGSGAKRQIVTGVTPDLLSLLDLDALLSDPRLVVQDETI